MAYTQLYRRQNGAFFPVHNVFPGSIYHDPFVLTVHVHSHLFHPHHLPEEVADNLSWGDYSEPSSLNWRLVLKKDEERRKPSVVA